MGNSMYYPDKQRVNPNWPLRSCCGCIPNPAGMIIYGILGILAILNIFQLNNPNRKAFMEDKCAADDVVDKLNRWGAFGLFQIIMSVITGIVVLWLGIVGCQLQGKTAGSVEQGGCCGQQTGKCVGSCGTVMVLLVGFLAIIQNIWMVAGAKDFALATCCQILAWDVHEGDISAGAGGFDISKEGGDHLKMCGFKKDGSDFITGLAGGGDEPFGDEGNKKVEDSDVKNWWMVTGIVQLIVTLIFCPLCATFVYSATYEVSEAGAGGSAGGTAVSSV